MFRTAAAVAVVGVCSSFEFYWRYYVVSWKTTFVQLCFYLYQSDLKASCVQWKLNNYFKWPCFAQCSALTFSYHSPFPLGIFTLKKRVVILRAILYLQELIDWIKTWWLAKCKASVSGLENSSELKAIIPNSPVKSFLFHWLTCITTCSTEGKFQMEVLPRCGHCVHEDAPDKVSKRTVPCKTP